MPSGATGPLRSETGALEDKVLWRVLVAIVAGEERRSDQLGVKKVGGSKSVWRRTKKTDRAGR